MGLFEVVKNNYLYKNKIDIVILDIIFIILEPFLQSLNILID